MFALASYRNIYMYTNKQTVTPFQWAVVVLHKIASNCFQITQNKRKVHQHYFLNWILQQYEDLLALPHADEVLQ